MATMLEGADALGGFDAGHAGHVDVHEHEIVLGGEALDDPHRVQAVVGDVALHTGRLEDPPNEG